MGAPRITRRQLKQLEKNQALLPTGKPKPVRKRKARADQFAPTFRCPGCQKQAGEATVALGPDGKLWHLTCRDKEFGRKLLHEILADQAAQPEVAF